MVVVERDILLSNLGGDLDLGFFYQKYLEDPSTLNELCAGLPGENLTPEYIALLLKSGAREFQDKKRIDKDLTTESL